LEKPLDKERLSVAFYMSGPGNIAIPSMLNMWRLKMNKFKCIKNKPYAWFLPLVLVVLNLASTTSQAAAIHNAAKSGELDQIQHLVVTGVDVNEKTVRGETPLIIAALAGNGEIVNYLLQRGADINAQSASGLTALHGAAYAGQTEIVLLLVTKGAEIDGSSNRFGTTPLILATEENHIETVGSLIKHGADVNVVEMNGISATSKAGWREHWDVMKLLLANGATCQPVEIAGDWLYDECTSRASAN
jgi:ankyrin repeat protein